MRNGRKLWGPRGMRQARPAQGLGAQRPMQTLWQSALQGRQMVWSMRQKALQAGLLSRLDLLKQGANQRVRLLDTIRTRLQGAVADQPASTSVYDVSAETSPVSTDSSSTTPTTEPSGGNGAKQPSNRTLYAIFEKLDKDDIGDNDYPLLRIVNDALEDKGHDPTDRSTIYAAYDKFLHHEALEREDGEDEDKKHKGRTTDDVLNKAFKSLKRNREKNFTEAGTPRIDAVKDWLEDHDYTVVSTDKIKEAWEDYQESDEHEDKEHKQRTTHAVLNQAFKKLKSQKDFITEAGTPRIDTVKDWLEENNYTVVSTDKIKEAWEDYQESDEHEDKEHKGRTTDDVLNRAFDSLKRNREKNFTEAGTPRIDAAKDWLEDHDYTVVSSDKIREAWEDYSKS